MRLEDKTGKELGTDKVKMIVADMIFAIFGDGVNVQGKISFLKNTYLEKKKKDKRTDPYIIKGKAEGKKEKDCYYSVDIFPSKKKPGEKYIKIALAREGYVLYSGHSNFGMGFCFKKNLEHVKDFVNMASPLQSINWQHMRLKQGHPKFTLDLNEEEIELSEYGDDPETDEKYDPWGIGIREKGAHFPLKTAEYTSKQTEPNSMHFFLQHRPEGTKRWDTDYHYKIEEKKKKKKKFVYYIIYKAGAADMPEKRWKKLFLNSCSSGKYYYRVFNHGTLFYTRESLSFPIAKKTNLIFIKSIINGEDNESIYDALDGTVEDLYDYKTFNK